MNYIVCFKDGRERLYEDVALRLNPSFIFIYLTNAGVETYDAEEIDQIYVTSLTGAEIEGTIEE